MVNVNWARKSSQRAWPGVISFLERMEETMVLSVRMVKYCPSRVSGQVLDGGGLGGVAGEMLGQYGSIGEVGGVSGDIEMANGVGDLKDRGRGDALLEGPYGCLQRRRCGRGIRRLKRHGVEFLLLEDREDLAEVLKVGLEGGAEDKDVIKVDDDADFEEVAEDVVHGTERGRRSCGCPPRGYGSGGSHCEGRSWWFVGDPIGDNGSSPICLEVGALLGDERKVGNDGGGEVVAEGTDILDEAVRGTGLAEVAELFKVVINGFLGAKSGSEKVGPLEEGVTWSSGGSAVADFSHPPFGGIAEEAGGGNGEPVGKVQVVEVKRVLELDGVDAVAEATTADEVEADTAAAAAAAATAAARWEVLVWHGGMWRCRCGRGGGGEGIYNMN
ncbi:hypothetical protein CBR_g24040 [Chara braunii]|uniref:Uncharacterized protein n=1 Tax=Chara braunii TaxID=69332 RepID=A0A388L5V8_CHABU|nr:hypothetical protein CBR_g24040 [Chara braunii]|eukprot:GBG77593.1 hypothetical protein CBR_g24040 [Chara braunii]